jgi:hypothetical protein
MTELLRATLARRDTVAPDTLLDCLALAAELEPRIVQDNGARLVTLAELRRTWWCRSNNEVIQRMYALTTAKLVDTTYHSGRNAWWEVHCVGPVA